MNELTQTHITKSEEQVKTKTPWEPDRAHDQEVFSFVNDTNNNQNDQDGKWLPLDDDSAIPHTEAGQEIDHISVLSWNIDFMLPHPDSRMEIAIDHLRDLIESATQKSSTVAHIIFFAECLQTDLNLILAHRYIRQNFFITDFDDANWENGYYGTTTLIDRRLQIKKCFRVHYSQSQMQRDGLFIDILLGPEKKLIRLCNTHLESLALDPPFRPSQLKTSAEFMKDVNVHAAILAGDLNAIQPFDQTLATENGLKDAYLETGGSEQDPKGHTWGQQAATELRERFGTSRMDKVLYCGGLVLRSFSYFGQDVQLVDPTEREDVVKLGFDKPWITDHLGVMATFGVSESAPTIL